MTLPGHRRNYNKRVKKGMVSVSILQEYEEIRNTIGEETYKKVNHFLDNHPEYLISDVYYKSKVWEEMCREENVPFTPYEASDEIDF